MYGSSLYYSIYLLFCIFVSFHHEKEAMGIRKHCNSGLGLLSRLKKELVKILIM